MHRCVIRAAARLGVALALSITGPAFGQWSGVIFDVVAHEDDWQLFFNPSSFKDVKDATVKVVFVYTTAGDAGLGVGPSGAPYYAAREEGARRAVRFMTNVGSLPATGNFASTLVNGHAISKYTYKNTVSYFLRLPDGSRTGSGYGSTGWVSLERLRTGAIPQLSAVDGSATYRGWADLVDTLEALVRGELLNTGAKYSWLYIQDSSPQNNPRDHSDHANTGHAMDTVASRMSCLGVARFVDYHCSNLAANLSPGDMIDKAGVFAVTTSGVTEMGHGTTWLKNHLAWLGRSYYRTSTGDGSNCFNAGHPCDASSCAGCCDTNGVCQAGSSTLSCGHGGDSCRNCSRSSTPMCIDRTCSACDHGHLLCCDDRCHPTCAGIRCR